MAIFRKVHTSFWSDPFIEDLDRDQKLFYLYLITNDKTRQCGIYEITKKQIAYDLGYTIDTVSKHIAYFIKTGKIRYNEDSKELAIKNWLKYNSSTSPKVKSCIDKEFENVKDKILIEYLYSTDTQSQEEQEQEEEREKEQDADFIPQTPLEIKFAEFIKFRKQKKSPIVPASLQAFKDKLWKLSNQNEQIAIEILNESIANGWTGIFELKNNNNGKQESGISKNQHLRDKIRADFENKVNERFSTTTTE